MVSAAADTRYNLVFAGQLLPGTDRARAERTLAAFFGLRDPAAVRVFFSGRPVPLRRDLSREQALRLYRQLRGVGLICEVPPAEAEGLPYGTEAGAPAAADTPTAPPMMKPVEGTALARSSDRAIDRPDGATNTAAPRRGRAPNYFALRPALPARADELLERAQLRALVCAAIAAALCLVVVVVNLRFAAPAPGNEPIGPLAATSLAGGGLALMLDDALLLHARSGLPRQRVDARTLGLAALAPPLHAASDGSMLLRGRAQDAEQWQLFRCRLPDDAPGCRALLPVPPPPALLALSESYLGDALFLQFSEGRLLRSSAAGEVESESITQAPRAPAPMLYHEGLLLIPASDAPLMGVYRPDPGRFGEQLDALFLMTPAGASPAERIADVAATTDDRYALLEDRDGNRRLYRFDTAWGSARPVAFEAPLAPDAYLVTWRDRLLVASRKRADQIRVAPGGLVETAFESTMLAEAHDAWERAVTRQELIRRAGLIAPLTVATALLLFAALQAAIARAARNAPPPRTALLDPMPAGIRWLQTAPQQVAAADKLGYLLLAASLLPAVALLLSGAGGRVVCLLPAALAAFQARALLLRGCGGHFGQLDGEIIAVDWDGHYFYGRDGLCGAGLGFLFAGGVALPVSVPGLGALAPSLAPPTARHLDIITAIGLLTQLQHPWLRAAVLCLLGVLISLGAWLLTA